MLKKDGAKKKCLERILLEFAIDLGGAKDKRIFNPQWHKLWCRIAALKIFK